MLDGVTRAFGALRAVDDVSLSVAAGQKYAVLGSNGAGKTTLFNAITGDFPPTAGRIRFFGEDITELPPHERIRKGLRRTYQSSLLFRDLTVRDNLFLAVRGVASGRFSFLRARAGHASHAWPRNDLLERARLTHIADELVANLAHGQQRQLEIGMALAGAPRLILFDEPAAGLSPAERRELVALLRSLPAHMSFVLIEHDLDIALRVVERVTVMHNGRVLKTGTPERDRERRPGAGDLHGRQALMAWFGDARRRRASRSGPILVVEGLDVYYGRAHALQGVSLTHRQRRARHRRPQRHGQDHAVQRHHRPGAGAAAACKLAGEEILGLRAERDHQARHRLRAAGPARVAVADGRRDLRLVAPQASATSSASTRCSRAWPSARATAARSSRAASSRCWRSAARCCCNPRLLVMDEPTEGLAPVIVEQVAQALRDAGRRRRDRGAADRAEPRRGASRWPTASA